MTITGLPLIVILGLAAFRATRFIVDDDLWEGTRNRLLRWLIPRRGPVPFWKEKLAILLQCYWCVGIWVSFLLVSIVFAAWPWQLGIDGWVAVWAVAGVQSLCSTAADTMIESI